MKTTRTPGTRRARHSASKGKPSKSNSGKLRQRAEKRMLESQPPPKAGATAQDAQKLMHELRVHQVELEMQNEELLRARQDLEECLARYKDLYDSAPIGYLVPDRTLVIVLGCFWPNWRQDFDREHVRRRQSVPVAAQESRPRASARRRFQTVFPQQSTNRVATDLVAQVPQGIADAGVAPRRVLASLKA